MHGSWLLTHRQVAAVRKAANMSIGTILTSLNDAPEIQRDFIDQIKTLAAATYYADRVMFDLSFFFFVRHLLRISMSLSSQSDPLQFCVHLREPTRTPAKRTLPERLPTCTPRAGPRPRGERPRCCDALPGQLQKAAR
jgi:hypothetical protein